MTITPTAIDGFVLAEVVRVVGRHRTDLGHIDELARSIDDIGLLHPIVLTRDCRLVAGERRLAACRMLGWDTIPVRFVDNLDDATRLLHAERDENRCRKDMLPSEMASLGAALYEIEAAAARERQREAGRANGRGIASGTRTGSYAESGDGQRAPTTVDAVGEALGMAGRTYQELRYVHEIATKADDPTDRQLAAAALSNMDNGAGVAGEARRLRAQLHTRDEVRKVRDAATTAPPTPDPGNSDVPGDVWLPDRADNTIAAARQRRRLIQHYAEMGYSSEQIGNRIGLTDVTVRRYARLDGLSIQADEAMGPRTRKTIDSNRIVRETAIALEGLVMAANLVRLDDLDDPEAANWAASITTSTRALNRLAKQIKGRTTQ